MTCLKVKIFWSALVAIWLLQSCASSPFLETPPIPTQASPLVSETLMQSGSIWLGKTKETPETAVILPDGTTQVLDVAVFSVSPDGSYAIYARTTSGDPTQPAIANLKSGSSKKLPIEEGTLFVVPTSPTFVFSADSKEFVFLLVSPTDSLWRLRFCSSDSGECPNAIQDSDFQASDANARNDEIAVPLAWKPQTSLWLAGGRANTDANFGTLKLNPVSAKWQRFATTSVPQVSTGGSMLAYVDHDSKYAGGMVDGANVVRILDPGTGRAKTIPQPEVADRTLGFPLLDLLAWSPDDGRVLFLRRAFDTAKGKEGTSIQIADLKESQSHEIALDSRGTVTDITWTKEGIFYLVYDGQETRLVRIDPDAPAKGPEVIRQLNGKWTRILAVW